VNALLAGGIFDTGLPLPISIYKFIADNYMAIVVYSHYKESRISFIKLFYLGTRGKLLLLLLLLFCFTVSSTEIIHSNDELH